MASRKSGQLTNLLTPIAPLYGHSICSRKCYHFDVQKLYQSLLAANQNSVSSIKLGVNIHEFAVCKHPALYCNSRWPNLSFCDSLGCWVAHKWWQQLVGLLDYKYGVKDTSWVAHQMMATTCGALTLQIWVGHWNGHSSANFWKGYQLILIFLWKIILSHIAQKERSNRKIAHEYDWNWMRNYIWKCCLTLNKHKLGNKFGLYYVNNEWKNVLQWWKCIYGQISSWCEFVLQFWKLRQSEVEPYTLQYSPLKVKYGDLTDPVCALFSQPFQIFDGYSMRISDEVIT